MNVSDIYRRLSISIGHLALALDDDSGVTHGDCAERLGFALMHFEFGTSAFSHVGVRRSYTALSIALKSAYPLIQTQ